MQLTRDGGKTWTNVVANVPGLPPASWVSWVEASRFDDGRGLRHLRSPHVRRHDAVGLPDGRLRQDLDADRRARAGRPRLRARASRRTRSSPTLLFVGTEFGLWISVDGGATWARVQGRATSRASRCAISQVQPRDDDLVLATHGRGIWIVDDLTPLRALTADALAPRGGVPARPAGAAAHAGPAAAGSRATRASSGTNPPSGAVITYYQRDAPPLRPDQARGPRRRRARSSTRSRRRKRRGHQPRRLVDAGEAAARAARGAARLRRARRGRACCPGTYTVRLTKGDQVDRDEARRRPRSPRRPTARPTARRSSTRRCGSHALFGRMSALVDRIDARAPRRRRARRRCPPTTRRRSGSTPSTKLDEVRRRSWRPRRAAPSPARSGSASTSTGSTARSSSWEGRPGALPGRAHRRARARARRRREGVRRARAALSRSAGSTAARAS